MDRKRLLIFHPALAPYRVDFFNELGKAFDMRVVFMTRNNANQHFRQEELTKDATYSIGYLDKHYTVLKRNINIGYKREIERFNPDIVVCNEFGVSLWASYITQKINLRNFKLYTICDDSEVVLEDRKGLRKTLSRYFSRRIDGLIVVNPKVKKKYEQIGAKKVILFPIIAKDSEFEKKIAKAVPITNEYIANYKLSGTKCLIFVGRLTEVKNLERLIEAFSIAAKISSSYRLILVGDGELKQNLLLLVENLSLSEKVIFAGRYEGKDLLAWYNLNGSCVLISTHEPFGAVVAESLMAGMPVIVSDQAGSKCLVDESNGIICTPFETKEIASCIEDMFAKLPYIKPIERTRASMLPYKFDDLMQNLITQFLQ